MCIVPRRWSTHFRCGRNSSKTALLTGSCWYCYWLIHSVLYQIDELSSSSSPSSLIIRVHLPDGSIGSSHVKDVAESVKRISANGRRWDDFGLGHFAATTTHMLTRPSSNTSWIHLSVSSCYWRYDYQQQKARQSWSPAAKLLTRIRAGTTPTVSASRQSHGGTQLRLARPFIHKMICNIVLFTTATKIHRIVHLWQTQEVVVNVGLDDDDLSFYSWCTTCSRNRSQPGFLAVLPTACKAALYKLPFQPVSFQSLIVSSSTLLDSTSCLVQTYPRPFFRESCSLWQQSPCTITVWWWGTSVRSWNDCRSSSRRFPAQQQHHYSTNISTNSNSNNI